MEGLQALANMCAATNEQRTNAAAVTVPPPAIPYAVGTQIKRRVRTMKFLFGEESPFICWHPATIIAYNATTSRYTIEYEEGGHQDLEHAVINTEPFPMEPRYPCGMKLEKSGLGEIVARSLYIPSDTDRQQYMTQPIDGDCRQYVTKPTWMYRMKYREANAEDYFEPDIENILERMQQRKQQEEGKSTKLKPQAQKSRTSNTSEGTHEEVATDPTPPIDPNSNQGGVLQEYFAQHQISPEDIATSIHVLQVVAKLASKSSSSNNGTENSKKRNRQHNNNNSNNRNSENNNIDADVLENTKTSSALSEIFDLYRTSKTMRPLRKALTDCYHNTVAKHMYQGLGTKANFRQHKEDAHLSLAKRRKLAETTMQQKYLATTQLRQGRINKLNAKLDEGETEEQRKLAARMMIPDGPVETTTTTSTVPTTVLQITQGSSAASSVEEDGNDTEEATATIELPKLRSCYVCKQRFRDLHVFYDQLCPPCATLNYTKRLEHRDLTGYTAVVTGARVKIGYHTCLKLLRAGCTVIATTRFPNSAVAAYRNAPDFSTWQSRLSIYGLDLRDVTGIELFCRYLAQKLVAGPNKNGTGNGLDILINNACQTIRRPTAYYRPQVEQEQALWRESDATHKAILRDCRDYEGFRRQLHDTTTTQPLGAGGLSAGGMPVPRLEASVATATFDPAIPSDGTNGGAAASSVLTTSSAVSTEAALVTASSLSSTSAPFERTGMSHSAAASQMVLCPDDVGVDAAVLPPGLSDVNQQQLDLRTTNSWLLHLGQVSTPEVMECMFVNAIAPFLLNSKLQPLMIHRGTGSGNNNDVDDNTKNTDNADTDTAVHTRNRYIVNVSAMEGKFYRYKMSHHPHTNMAKAALNMMTRTSSEHLAKQHGIYMNSIDTGWINDENPLERASKTAKVNNFQTPIDEIDAAARILDPIMTNAQLYGKFLKDYRETEW